MNGSKHPEPVDQPDQVVKELEREIKRLRAENEGLEKKIEGLEEELRASRRQAAPFSNGQRKANPKRPGRKAGQGIFRHRPAPAESIGGEIVEAVAPAGCPSCGGALAVEGEEWATTTDLPVQPQPQVTRYRVPVCRCSQCGKRVRGTAPGLAADQFGATAHRVGAGVKAAAHALHYGAGVPVRKLPMVLKELTGIALTQGAMTQDALRRGEAEVGARYRQLCGGMRDSPVVNTDDTGWRVGGSTAHLMVFVGEQSTVYQIRARHRNEEVREVIPADYAGVMGTDRGKSYDAEEFDAVDQQKCLGHLQRNITEVLETKKGRAREFGLGLKNILHQSIELHHKRFDLAPADYQLQTQQIDETLTFHLRHRILKDDDNQRLLDGIGIHQDRGNLLRFLRVEGLEPTNNRAERALRPAVIARKVSHCSKNQRGADAFAAFVSVIQTATQAGASSTIAYLRNLFSTPAPPSG
jgi:transposase